MLPETIVPGEVRVVIVDESRYLCGHVREVVTAFSTYILIKNEEFKYFLKNVKTLKIQFP